MQPRAPGSLRRCELGAGLALRRAGNTAAQKRRRGRRASGLGAEAGPPLSPSSHIHGEREGGREEECGRLSELERDNE